MTTQASALQQLAQRFIVGYEGLDPRSPENEPFRQFLAAGLGGVILFRSNFQDGAHTLTPQEIAETIHWLQNQRPEGVAPLVISLDQEGGQVERLPFTVFPSTVTPRAIALNQTADPVATARAIVFHTARCLRALGFNLNYAPTLDVNLNRMNPIIGVRAFGEDPDTVWRFAQTVLEAQQAAGILSVGKHFPGHGNGTVDSHERMPILTFTETELTPFRQAIAHGVGSMMVSHGYYPALQEAAGEQGVPASASPTILRRWLRQECGFTGVIMTDDMVMGAITQNQTPLESAMASLEAGADVLVYRTATETEWAVLTGLADALAVGQLNAEEHQQSLSRIVAMKASVPPPSAPDSADLKALFASDAIVNASQEAARATLSVCSGQPTEILPLSSSSRWALIHPRREDILNYHWDQPLSPEWPQVFAQTTGMLPVWELGYSLTGEIALPDLDEPIDGILFIGWNTIRFPEQLAVCRQLMARYPNVQWIWASAGTPDDDQAFASIGLCPALHLALCSFRPPTMQALADAVAGRFTLPNPASPLTAKV